MIHSVVHRFNNPDLGVLLLRVALGVVFIFHGWQKVGAMEQVIGFFATLGFPAYLAYAVAWIEMIGGALLIGGLFVRYAGLALAVIMAVAVYSVHLQNGFSISAGGYEFAALLGLGALALFFLGSGRYSIAAMMKRPQVVCEVCEVGIVRM